MPKTDPLSTVDRVFRVVEELWRLDGAGVTETAAALDLPKSTAHDYLRSLARSGYAIQEDGTYRLTTKFLQVGGRLKYRMALFHVARPELKWLASVTGEEANLTIEEAGQAVIVHAERGQRALNLGDYPGLHTPLHTHASGKAILAHLPTDRRDEIMERRGLPSVTPRTITDPEALREELRTIRDRGFAVDSDEQVLGMGVVAAPIRGEDPVPVHGAVGVVCPTRRLEDPEYVDELSDAVRQASNVIEVNHKYGS